MIRKILFAALFSPLLVLSSIATAQTIQPEIKKVVTFIFPADPQGELLRDPKTHDPVPYGTGFFVGVQSDDKKLTYSYLVTAKHVLKDEKGNDFARIYLRLNTLKGDAQFVPLDLLPSGQKVVHVHPDPTVDIAVVPALPSQAMFDFKVIPDDMLSTKETFNEFKIAEGSEVFFLGLFTTYYGEHKNVPIFRFGRVAMFPDDPIAWINYAGQPEQKAELYLIETQSYGGNSGSPVFFALGSAERAPPGVLLLNASPLLKLAGIMRGRFNDTHPALGLLQTPTGSTPVTLPNIGIAAVTPSYFLHDILFSDELKKLRADKPSPEKGD
jgi:hypothetical protein